MHLKRKIHLVFECAIRICVSIWLLSMTVDEIMSISTGSVNHENISVRI